MFLVSVSKAYNNSNGQISSRRKPKNARFAYYVDENQKFHKQKLTKLEYFIFKYLKTKYKKVKFLCQVCNRTFFGIVKKHKKQIECPFCID